MGDYHRNSPEEIDSPFRSLLKINLKDKMKKGKVSLFAPKASLDYHYPSVNNKDTSRRYHKPLLLRVKEDQV